LSSLMHMDRTPVHILEGMLSYCTLMLLPIARNPPTEYQPSAINKHISILSVVGAVKACTTSDIRHLIPVFVFICLALTPHCLGGERIKVLLTGQILDRAAQIPKFLGDEPLVDVIAVPARGDYILGGTQTMIKYVRQYFPRTYEEMQSIDYIMFISPEYYLFTTKQDKWMYDVITEGSGGFNDASVFSIVAQIHDAWAASLTQLAFPNDAPAVVARGGGGESPVTHFNVIVNREFPDPVLMSYLPYGIENVVCAESRYIIPREGSGTIAWQAGNFPGKKDVPYLIVWDYGKGRTMTIGDAMHKDLGFFRYPKTPTDNIFAPDILTNIILYSTRRELIRDVEVFHRLKSYFIDFRSRIAVLVSLSDFVEKFGANTAKIQQQVLDLEDMARLGTEQYLDQEFSECEATMIGAFQDFHRVEEMAKRLKNNALSWVFAIEWLITTSVFLISGSLLWTLMARKKLYREVESTKFN